MRQYTRIIITPSSHTDIKYASPGIVGGSAFYFFAQSGCILQMTRDANYTAASVEVIITRTGDGVTYGATYSFAFSDVVYADVTALVRPLIQRPVPSVATLAGTGSVTMDINVYDGDGVLLDTVQRSCRIIDGIDWAIDGKMKRVLPDVVYITSDSTYAPMTFPASDIGSGVGTVKFAGLTIDNSGLSVTAIGTGLYELESDGDVVDSVDVREADCADGHMTVTWWSPELGGWKSYAFEVLREGMSVSGLTDYTRDFSPHRASDGRMWYALRAPLATFRDWLWLRDILASDVVMTRAAIATDNLNEVDSWMHLIADGDPGEWKLNDRKDFEIRVYASEVAGLW